MGRTKPTSDLWMQGSHTAWTLVLSAFASLTCDVRHISTVLSGLKEPLTDSFTGETEASLLLRLATPGDSLRSARV